MPKFLVTYDLEGSGKTIIEADTADAASAKFQSGDWNRLPGDEDVSFDLYEVEELSD